MTTALREITGICTRAYDFEPTKAGTGRHLEGYAAIFNSRTRIPDRGGDFEESIRPGAFTRSLRENGPPLMMWDHGKDPRVGTVPIGVYHKVHEDSRGLRVEGELFDNPVVEPVRQAIAAGAVRGMSFRFKVSKNGDSWSRRGLGQMDQREVRDADCHEAGPVAFPAYKGATVSLRDALPDMDDEEIWDNVAELRTLAGLEIDDMVPWTEWRSPEEIEAEERQRQADYVLGQPLERILAPIEAITGIRTVRILDRLEAKRERQQLDRKAAVEQVLAAGRAEKRAARRSELAYDEWRHRPLPDSWTRLSEARAVHQAATEELLEACCHDTGQVAAVRRRVAS